jgi:hypothetical protein
MAEVLMKTWKGANFCFQACVERRSEVRKKCGMHISVKCVVKEYRMVFCAGLRYPCTRDVARLLESVKILKPHASVVLRLKVEQHPKCMVMLSCLENCFIIELFYKITTVKQWHFENPAKIPLRHFNSLCRIAWSCTAIDQSNCVFHCSYYISSLHSHNNLHLLLVSFEYYSKSKLN